ncbi:PAS domain S-box protein [Pseudophaeobacter sp.]|uniref:PAS domain S-box protein n=1 Tax=Pseudophaeobacter sp. TaxID=1971739 RepID=UPI00329712B7
MKNTSDSTKRIGTLEASLQAILSSAVDAIIIIRHDGTIETVNEAAADLFQYDIGEFLGQNVKFLMPDTHRSKHDGYLHNYNTTGFRKIIGIGREVTGQRKDGSIFPMHLSVGEFEDNGTKYYTGIIHNLSMRKDAEQALLQAQKMDAIGQLTGGVAHDFNNLLTVIVGNLELMEMQMGTFAHSDLLKEALEAADLGARLTERLLAFARRSPLEPHVVELNGLVGGLTDMLQRTLGATIELQTVLSPAPWAVRVDPTQFESAIVNLAVNARDAMPRGGKLIVETRNVALDEDYLAEELGLTKDDYIQISVTDTGSGMPEKVIRRVFEPFYTTKDVGEGTGLGLSMVYGFGKQSDGHVTIYSELDKGTTVNLYLPRHRDSSAVSEEQEAELQPQSATGGTILVVEDDERVRRLTRARLEALGYRVLEAIHGPAAIEVLAEQTDIDLVFTDLVMPGGMSGYEVAQHVQDTRPDIKVLLTSGYAEELMNGDKLTERSLKLLRKPYRQAALAEAIKGALEG